MILGITGGIASGKSSVTEIFRLLGAAVVSADELAREAVRPGSVTLRKLVAHFGRNILQEDGTLNRKALAQRIFADPRAREALNRITHPAIADLAKERLRQLAEGEAPLVVYEAPLLFEAGAERRVDAVLVVRVDERVQLQRLMDRDGIGEKEALARIASQMKQEEKIARADYVVDNSGTFDETEALVRALFRRLTSAPPSGGEENRE